MNASRPDTQQNYLTALSAYREIGEISSQERWFSWNSVWGCASRSDRVANRSAFGSAMFVRVLRRARNSASTLEDLCRIKLDLLPRARQWLDGIEIRDRLVARMLYRAIPNRCPFERDIRLFGCQIARVPPLCKLNPLYEQLVGLRFRAFSYLAEQGLIDIHS